MGARACYTAAMPTGGRRAKRKAEPAAPTRALSDLEFVGCEAVPMTAAEFDACDGRLEVWDAETETAWVVREGRGPAHESPACSAHMLADIPEALPSRVVVAAALACDGEQDFHARLRRG